VSVWAAPAINAITQLTGDVTAGPGTGSVAATVVRVNGATVPAAGALTTGNSAYVSGASALTYSALNLAGGSGWVVNALPVGNLAFGTSGQLLVTNAGATAAAWVSASQDATLAASGAFTVTQAQAGAITFASGTGLIGFASADTGPGLSQASTSGATGKNLVLTPQPSTNGNGTSGNVVIALTAPTGSGSEAGLIVTRSGTTIASIQTGVTLSPAIGLYLGGNAASPTGVNYSLLEQSGDTFINDTAALYFRLSNVTQLVANGNFVFTPSATSSATMFGSTGEVDFAQNVAIGTQSGGSFGGGVGVLELLNASTQPSTALSGGCVLAAKSGALAVYDTSAAAANITINSYGFLSSANATSGGIGWTQSANTAASGTAVNMTLAAQSATGGGASFGGSLNLSSGSAATAGSINLQIGGTTAIQISSNGSLNLENSASGQIVFANTVSGAANSMTLVAQTSTAGTGGNFTGEAGGGVTGGNLLLYAGSGSTTNGSLTLSTVQGGGTPGSWNWGGPALSTTFASISGGVSITSITATLVKGFPMLINGTTVHLLCTG
jgi:hypothetical protein